MSKVTQKALLSFSKWYKKESIL